MLFSNESRKGLLIQLLLIPAALAFLLTWIAPPWAFTASLSPAPVDPRFRPLSPQAAWTNFSPTGWSNVQVVTVSVVVSDAVGLKPGTAAYRSVTGGDITAAAWTKTSLSVDNAGSTSATLTVSGLALIDSAVSNQVQFKIDDQDGVAVESPVYTVRVDSTPPTSAITDPAPGSVITSTSTAIQGTSLDAVSGVSQVQLSVNGGAWQTASGTDSWTQSWSIPSADGVTYSLGARATDRAGNTESPGSTVSVTVDNVSPTSSISKPAAGELLAGETYTVTGTASDGYGVSAVEVSFDGIDWQRATGTNPWFYSWTLPMTGSFNIRSRATDIAGNVETPNANTPIIVENRPPSSSITSPNDGDLLSASTLVVRGTASLNAIAVEITLDGVTWLPVEGTISWQYVWTSPADGAYQLKTRARDLRGRLEEPGPGVRVTIDNTLPKSSISAPTPGQVISATTLSVAGTASDASGISKVEIWLGAGSWVPVFGTNGWTYDWTLPRVDGAGYVLRSRARDRAGNVESPGPGVAVTIDNVPPRASVSPLPATLRTTDIQVQWSGSDGLGIGGYDVQARVDEGEWTDWMQSTTANSAVFSGRGGHTYSFRARARDLAGNQGSYSAEGDTTATIPIFTVLLPLISNPPAFALSQFGVDRQVANGGDELAYSLHISNSSRQSLAAAVRAPVPENTTFVSDSASPGMVYDGSALVWSGQVPALGSQDLSFRVRVSDVFSGEVLAGATITGGAASIDLDARTSVAVANGRFEVGNLSGWATGGALGISAGVQAGRSGQGALLGNPGYQCAAGVPVDRSEMYQTVRVPNGGSARLSFWFRMFSQDVEYSTKFNSYGDTLDVHVRDVSGNVQQLLRFGAPFRPVDCASAPYDSGWQLRTYDLSAFRGQDVQIHFALWNRIDGWYNSYAYVDDVRVD